MPRQSLTSAGVLFRVAAGPRQGYGHLVRATVVARALGVRPRVAVRGGADACRVARDLGCDLVDGTAAALAGDRRLSLLVIDDPCRRDADRWCRTFRRARVPVASIHDLGLAYCGADLTIDGSVTQRGRHPRGAALVGPRFAILTPARSGAARGRGDGPVLIALGGGRRQQVALALAAAIRRRHAGMHVRIAAGFGPRVSTRAPEGVSWLSAPSGLAQALTEAVVVVAGGGVTLYEACRAGAPSVGVAVVPAQRPAIEALAGRGAVLDGGTTRNIGAAVGQVTRAIEQASLRRNLARRGPRLIDGLGVARVARALLALCTRAPAREERRP